MEKKGYRGLSKDEQYNYLKEKLNYEDGNFIHGKVKSTPYGQYFICFYGVDGKIINIKSLLGETILSYDEDEVIPDNDGIYYVCGQVITSSKRNFPYFKPSQVYENEAAFKRELLEEKWIEEDFEHELEAFVFDGQPYYASWCAEKIKVIIENKIKELKEKGKEEEEKLIEEKKNIEIEINNLNEELDRKNKEIQNIDQTYRKYEMWGIIKEEKPKGKKYSFKGFTPLINDVRGFLWNEKELYYEYETIRCFLSAMRTQQLIILWGRPGTGKTSLPKAIADAIGAEYTPIRVQSNWTDNQDLLGYYNPVDKIYVATEFLDAIVAAKQNPKVLHFITLDEMNLSCVEYYFSEMLNYFTRGDEPYKIRLYSERIKEYIESELKDAEEADKRKLERVEENMAVYSPLFVIPDNVIIVGTLNSDETTKSISPKVIDRSCLIELRDFKPSDDDKKLKSSLKGKYVDPSVFGKDKEIISGSESNEDIVEFEKFIENLKEILGKDISLSHRLSSYVRQWMAGDTNSHCEFKECKDDIVLTKILPLLESVSFTDENNDNLNNFNEAIKELPQSKAKFERMQESAEVGKLKYWEK